MIHSHTPAAAEDLVAMFSGVKDSSARVALIALKLLSGTLSPSIAA